MVWYGMVLCVVLGMSLRLSFGMFRVLFLSRRRRSELLARVVVVVWVRAECACDTFNLVPHRQNHQVWCTKKKRKKKSHFSTPDPFLGERKKQDAIRIQHMALSYQVVVVAVL